MALQRLSRKRVSMLPHKSMHFNTPLVFPSLGRRASAPRKSCLPASSSDVQADKEGGVFFSQGSVSVPSSRCRADTPGPCSGRIYVVDPGQPHPERSDNRTPEYSQSRNSPPSPVSPPPTFSNLDYMLFFTVGSVLRFPQAPPLSPHPQYPSPTLVYPSSPGPR